MDNNPGHFKGKNSQSEDISQSQVSYRVNNYDERIDMRQRDIMEGRIENKMTFAVDVNERDKYNGAFPEKDQTESHLL